MKTHGQRNTRLYRIWANMKTRCYNTRDPHYKNWGARGIEVCEEWRDDFTTFRDWAKSNGYTDDLTLDRINNDGNYTPGNCRWATHAEQRENKQRPLKRIEFGGESLTISEWTKRRGLGKETIRERLKKGWTEEEALNGRPGSPRKRRSVDEIREIRKLHREGWKGSDIEKKYDLPGGTVSRIVNGHLYSGVGLDTEPQDE